MSLMSEKTLEVVQAVVVAPDTPQTRALIAEFMSELLALHESDAVALDRHLAYALWTIDDYVAIYVLRKAYQAKSYEPIGNFIEHHATKIRGYMNNAGGEEKVEELETEIKLLKSELETANALSKSSGIETEKLKAENNELEVKDDGLKVVNDELKVVIDNLDADNVELKEKNDKLEAENSKLEIEKAKLEAENVELKAENNDLRAHPV